MALHQKFYDKPWGMTMAYNRFGLTLIAILGCSAIATASNAEDLLPAKSAPQDGMKAAEANEAKIADGIIAKASALINSQQQIENKRKPILPPDEAFKILNDIKVSMRSGGRARIYVIRQMVHWGDSRESRAAQQISGLLFAELKILPKELAYAVIPDLSSNDVGAQKRAKLILGSVDHAATLSKNYYNYREYLLSERPNREDINLIKYMFSHGSRDALLVMIQLHLKQRDSGPLFVLSGKIDGVLLAEAYGAVVEQSDIQLARKSLAAMVDRKEWWARYYAVEVMRQCKACRDSDLVKKLVEDENEAVRTYAKQLSPTPTRTKTPSRDSSGQ